MRDHPVRRQQRVSLVFESGISRLKGAMFPATLQSKLSTKALQLWYGISETTRIALPTSTSSWRLNKRTGPSQSFGLPAAHLLSRAVNDKRGMHSGKEVATPKLINASEVCH